MHKKLPLTLLLIPGFLVMAPAAPSEAAATCVYSKYQNTSLDYARITDASGTCKEVRVRHHYVPASASKDYWTSWAKGADVAQTGRQSELFGAEFAATQA